MCKSSWHKADERNEWNVRKHFENSVKLVYDFGIRDLVNRWANS